MVYHITEYTPPGSSAWGTFNDLKSAVTAAIRACEGQKFDAIAVQGVSGMSLGFPLALALGKPIVVVRKPGEDSHWGGNPLCGMPAEDVKGAKFVFVDDFMSSGATRFRVRRAIEAAGGKLVAEYMSREDAYVIR